MPWGKYGKVQNPSCSNRKEVTKTDKDGNESLVTTSYKLKCIDSARFMAYLLSNLVDNLAEGIKIKLKIVIASLNMKVSKTI